MEYSVTITIEHFQVKTLQTMKQNRPFILLKISLYLYSPKCPEVPFTCEAGGLCTVRSWFSSMSLEFKMCFFDPEIRHEHCDSITNHTVHIYDVEMNPLACR